MDRKRVTGVEVGRNGQVLNILCRWTRHESKTMKEAALTENVGRTGFGGKTGVQFGQDRSLDDYRYFERRYIMWVVSQQVRERFWAGNRNVGHTFPCLS